MQIQEIVDLNVRMCHTCTFARQTEFAEAPTPLPPMSIDDEFAIYSKIPRPFLPVGQTSYASDFWPERFRRPAYRPTPEIDPEILRTMKVVGTTGYARNINNMKRNQVQYADVINKQRERNDRSDNRFSHHHKFMRQEINFSSRLTPKILISFVFVSYTLAQYNLGSSFFCLKFLDFLNIPYVFHFKKGLCKKFYFERVFLHFFTFCKLFV